MCVCVRVCACVCVPEEGRRERERGRGISWWVYWERLIILLPRTLVVTRHNAYFGDSTRNYEGLEIRCRRGWGGVGLGCGGGGGGRVIGGREVKGKGDRGYGRG